MNLEFCIKRHRNPIHLIKMKFLGHLLLLLGILCVMIKLNDGVPVGSPDIIVKEMRDIPQYHCLRYFKHDIQLMRRCRNHRIVQLVGRPYE
uniref:CSON014859 protein n=1 Tax=Culicoides sonorensis TaxID=179676 RepID=A0A336KRL2_CULSO